MLTVLFNAYTTDLISSLTAPIQNPYPHTLEGIAKRPDLFVSLERTNEITTTLLVVYLHLEHASPKTYVHYINAIRRMIDKFEEWVPGRSTN